MSGCSPNPLLERILQRTPRRYRLPELSEVTSAGVKGILPDDGRYSPALRLAVIIEHARRALAADAAPAPTLKQHFVDALAALIHEAMRSEAGDPVFQAMVLRHRAPSVQEYASLVTRVSRDRRRVLGLVNAIAHPAKLRRLPPGLPHEALTQLQGAAAASAWPAVIDAAQRLLSMRETRNDPLLAPSLLRLNDESSLQHLQRFNTLQADEQVRQYLALWEQQGPRPNSRAATEQGAASRRRGAAVETLATQALEALARRLDKIETTAPLYRVVTSMRVPASLAAGHEGAKTEWDAVLLKQAPDTSAGPLWDVHLLVEAKASPDAASTDFPRLLRGLRLLAHADPGLNYSFETRQGSVNLRGVSLSALCTDTAGLTATVLYCSNALDDKGPRLLSAASRMQLLSAPESLDFAAAEIEARPMDVGRLEPLWSQLLNSPQWKAVLHQTFTLRQVRELMVHPEDLLASVG